MIARVRMSTNGSLEGGSRSSSREKQPGVVTFAEAGEHKMRLRVKHAVEEKVSDQPIRLDSALFFFLAPLSLQMSGEPAIS